VAFVTMTISPVRNGFPSGHSWAICARRYVRTLLVVLTATVPSPGIITSSAVPFCMRRTSLF
jgi:hypothetical protein